MSRCSHSQKLQVQVTNGSLPCMWGLSYRPDSQRTSLLSQDDMVLVFITTKLYPIGISHPPSAQLASSCSWKPLEPITVPYVSYRTLTSPPRRIGGHSANSEIWWVLTRELSFSGDIRGSSPEGTPGDWQVVMPLCLR